MSWANSRHDDRSREGDEGRAALHSAVVEHVLQVQRQQEELGERNGADDRHRHVRAGHGAGPEDPHRQQRPGRAELDDDERADQCRRARKEGKRGEEPQPLVVARVIA